VVGRGEAETADAGLRAIISFFGVHGERGIRAGEDSGVASEDSRFVPVLFRRQPASAAGFLVGQAFAVLPWFRAIGMALYIALPIPMAMVYAGQLLRGREKAFPAMAAFLQTGPIGLLFYNLFPALGPARIFLQDFPWHPMTTAQAAHLLREPIAVKGVQNAIPSLHMAWVLLAWWYSRGLAMMFVVFTWLSRILLA
jgi:hypothetical protein